MDAANKPTLRPKMCDDCFFLPKYDVLRRNKTLAWTEAIVKCSDLQSPNQFCHTSTGQHYCAGMARWQQEHFGRMSDAVIESQKGNK